MEELELYHIHKKNETDKKWQEKNIIKINENFNSIMNKRHQRFSQLIIYDDEFQHGKTSFHLYLADYYSRIQNLKVIKNDDLEELKKLLEIGYEMSYNATFFKDETALENCRRDNFVELPSRLHSLYLCDSDGIEYWKDVISKENKEEVEVFKVLASGKIFKTNEQLLPNEFLDYSEAYNSAFSYWKPKFKNVPNYTNEYLIQGTVKILEKI